MSDIKLPDSAKISDSDYQHLKTCIQKGEVKSFIQAYKQKDPNLSDQNITTMGLIELITKDEILLSKDMLKLLYKSDSLEPDIFTTLDQNGKNVIIYALEQGICIPTLSSYIFDLNAQNKISKKYSMDIELMQKMKDIIMYPACDIHPTELIEDFIKPLYTEATHDSLIDLIGQEWLDSHYI